MLGDTLANFNNFASQFQNGKTLSVQAVFIMKMYAWYRYG